MPGQPEFSAEVEKALTVLRAGGVILYPTDTVWGIGCDATDEKAVERIYRIKQREDSKSMIVLVAGASGILEHVAAPDPEVFDFIENADRPTTIVFSNALGLASGLLAPDGSAGIRVTTDPFCRHLVKRLRHPLVSTSANLSGRPAPACFLDIPAEIIQAVDYVVDWRREETTAGMPSRVIRWQGNGKYEILRP